MTEKFLHELLKKYHVPIHIRKHMAKVSAVALFIAAAMKEQEHRINTTLLRQACLLHDFMKLCDFQELDLSHFQQTIGADDIQFWSNMIKSCRHLGHVQAAHDVLWELGEKKLAVIIQKHRFNSLIDQNLNARPGTWEEKLLYYADKRVCHDQIVTIKERLKDGQERYFHDGNIPASDALVAKALTQLENELCQKACLTPEQINEKNALPYWEDFTTAT